MTDARHGTLADVITGPRTIGEIPARWAVRDPQRPAMRTRSGRVRAYGELDDRTDRLARGLLSIGLQPGDRIAPWMADSFAYVELYLAAAKAGLVVAPINARLTAYEATHLIEDSDPRLVIWSGDLDDRVAEVNAEVLGDRHTLRVSDDARECALESLITRSPGGSTGVIVDPGSPFILGYTSGTTGRPKGAVLTHRSILEVARINAASYRMTTHPQVALTGSMSFVSVVPAHVLCTLRLGGCLTFMEKWDAEDLVDILERDLITFTYVPSPLLPDVAAALARRPRAWRNLRSVLQSASRARPDHLHALAEVVGTRLVEGWGMTEHSGGLMTATLGHEYLDASPSDSVFDSVGLPVLDVAVRVVGDDGRELPRDGQSVGELVIASPALMSGYWRRDEETAAVLRDGWFRTGDLGFIDAAGYLHIAERRTDLIVSGGANVYPREVEDAIASMPGVLEVAVVGVPHERWGQAVVAAVVTRDPAVTESAVIEHCRRRLAGYKKPTAVVFVDALPKTAGLKVSRAAVRRMVQDTQ
jgi:acyl-CoA synthetase (AMP-forming)/AMP-acid ligase II